MTDEIASLVRANLHEVFAERDRTKRRDAIRRTYAEDVVFTDPDGIATGWAALDEKAQHLLDDAPDFAFVAAGPVLVNHDSGYLAWAFGPTGAEPVVRGVDVSFVEDGRIRKVYTFLMPSRGA
jgi:hypothetical protein